MIKRIIFRLVYKLSMFTTEIQTSWECGKAHFDKRDFLSNYIIERISRQTIENRKYRKGI